MQTFTAKVSTSTEKHLIGSSPREMEDAVNELQRQLGDFDRTVEEYKQNLDMTVKLQQAVEEVGLSCGELIKHKMSTSVFVKYYREYRATVQRRCHEFINMLIPLITVVSWLESSLVQKQQG